MLTRAGAAAALVAAVAAVGAALASVGSWTELSPSASPPGRYFAGLATDRNGTVVLFGGTAATFLGDTWLWDGATWTQPSLTTAPSLRSGAAMATDGNGNLVLFGGIDASVSPPVYKDDTWLWDGSRWTQVATTVAPPARSAAGIALDKSGTVVLFGGSGPAGFLGDTWLWDGSSWTQALPSSSPSARSVPAMAADGSGNVVLFGGVHFGSIGVNHADTWLWDGSEWMQAAPLVSPPARSGPAMATAGNGTVVLFGGAGNAGFMDDTWLWDGTTWAEASPAIRPAGRANATMTTDKNGAVLLFGGFSPVIGAAGDTWLFGALTDTVPPVITVPPDQSVPATSPRGAHVTFAVTATDAVDGPLVSTCTPPSGSSFAIGDTVVSCHATDTAGNESVTAFTVHVQGALEQLADLADAVRGLGAGRGLAASVELARWFAAHRQPEVACVLVRAFAIRVRALAGKRIPPGQATTLIVDATRITHVLSC